MRLLLIVLFLFGLLAESQGQRFNRKNRGGNSGFGKSATTAPDVESPLSEEQKKKFAKAQPEDITNENFPETIESFDYPNAEISDVIKAISELTGKNFIIDPGVRGKITIIAPSQITVAEAYRAFLSALAINGYTIVPSGKFLKIRSSRNAQRDSIETYSGDYFPNSDQMITRIIHLKHISAEAVNKELRVLTSKDGEMSVYEQTNSIIISDYGSNIERVMRIIVQLDVPGFEEKLEVMRVRYAKAKDIADLIDQIVNKESDSGGNGRRSRFRSRRSRSKDAAETSSGGGGNASFHVIPDERTNSLIVVGNSAGIGRIRRLLRQLDFELTPEEAGGVFVYYVRHGDAEEISQTLSGVAKQAGGDGPTNSPRGRSGDDGPPVLTQQVFGGDVKITADKTTNSLIITASKQDYEVVLSLLEKIDIPRDQVFVEAVIMEMNVAEQDAKGAGVIRFSDGGRFPIGYNLISNYNELIGPLPAPGTTLGFNEGNEITIPIAGQTVTIKDTVGLINFITTHTQSNVLSTPQLTVLDNEEGEIEVGEKIVVGQTQTQTTTGNNSTSTNFEEADIKLKIKPFISPSSNSIRMEVDQIVKQPGKNISDTPGSQVTTKRGVKTNIVVNDGDTVVLGGLMRDEITQNESKVPLLGDIPILGWLFRSSSEVVTKVNLMIFLTPHIIRNSEDAKKLMSRKVDERIKFIKEAGGIDPFGEEFDRITRSGGALPPAAPPAQQQFLNEALPADDDLSLGTDTGPSDLSLDDGLDDDSEDPFASDTSLDDGLDSGLDGGDDLSDGLGLDAGEDEFGGGADTSLELNDSEGDL